MNNFTHSNKMQYREKVIETLLDLHCKQQDEYDRKDSDNNRFPFQIQQQMFSPIQISFDSILKLQQRLSQQQLSQKIDEQQDLEESQQVALTRKEIQQLCNQLSPQFSFLNLYEWQQELLLKTLQFQYLQRNLLISAGTASGKTHLVSIYILKYLLQLKQSVIFVVPYVALVDELTGRFKDLLPHNCCLCSLTGLKSLPQFINNKPTLFIVTIEKAVLLLKQMVEQMNLQKVGLCIIDEIHTSTDKQSDRSQKLELLISFMLNIQNNIRQYKNYKHLYKNIKITNKLQIIDEESQNQSNFFKIIAMSATIDNYEDFQKWLGAELYITQFRQAKLQELLYCQNHLYDFQTMNKLQQVSLVCDNPLISLILTAKKPLIVFCGTKKQCKFIAAQFAKIIEKQYKDVQNESLTEKRQDLRKQLTTDIQTLQQGVSHHSSELVQQDRQLIEEAFRERTIHTLIATTTLAAGVNLPARTVIINGLKIGIQQIDQQYYRQMVGRAGRTRDTDGVSILYLDSAEQLECVEDLKKKYICESQIMTDENTNNSINALLMMSYQLEQDLNQTLNSTLFRIQNQDFQLQSFQENLQFLIMNHIIATQSNRYYLSEFGKAINNAGISAVQSTYIYQLIEQLKVKGFDLFDEEITLLFVCAMPQLIYQQFCINEQNNEINQFKQQLKKQISSGIVDYEQIAQLSTFLLNFLEVDFQELNKLIVTKQPENQTKFYILQKIYTLKENIRILKQNDKKQLLNEEVLKSCVSLCGQMSCFCEYYQMPQLQHIIQMKQQEIRELLLDDITDLLSIKNVGVFRARILKQNGFNNAQQIVQCGLDKLKLVCNFGDVNEAAATRIFEGAAEACQGIIV